MNKIPLFIALLWSVMSCGQTNIVAEVQVLLQPNTIQQAEDKINEFLKKDSLNVDGLMMKGNVIFTKYGYSAPSILLVGTLDESIFETSIGSLGENKLMPDEATANDITKYFLKAVSIDKTREDIHLGICYIYSISVMTERLIQYLPVLKDNCKNKTNLPYTMGEYANNLIARNRFEDGMKVYQKIAELFPDNGGIMSDISGQYRLHGDLDKAKEYIEMAMKRKENDEMTFANAFANYNDLGDYKNALEALKIKCQIQRNKDYLLYQALLQFKDGKEFKNTLAEFLKTPSTDTPSIRLAEKMKVCKFAFDSYDSITRMEMPDAYKMLLYQYFVTKFPNEFTPSFSYGDILNYHQVYPKAIKIFKAMHPEKLDKEKAEAANFGLAWGYYKTKNFEEANKLWEGFLTSTNFYYKSAAAYFLGTYYQNKNQAEKANTYFKLVADKANESKYANFCANLMKK